MTRLLAGVLLVLAAAIALVPSDALGCGAAYRPGAQVDVADETALIVWDDANKVEHFVRRATFLGNVYDFGFLVPTPDRPTLAEASAELFDELAKITEPKTEFRSVTELNIGCSKGAPDVGKQDGLALPSGVIVLDQRRVGNLDAAMLTFRADTLPNLENAAFELVRWLKNNGYSVRPALADWLLPYIEQSWVITAFKVAGQPGSASAAIPAERSVALNSTTVRMSFKAERPYFPYREPADQRDADQGREPRLLRLFVAAKQRMEGNLGTGKTAWPGQTVWANHATDEERLTLLSKAKLPNETLASKWFITEFEDRSSPRPGTDEVYFSTSSDQSVVSRPVLFVTRFENPWWAGLFVILVPLGFTLGILHLIRRTLQRNRSEDSPTAAPKPPAEQGQKPDLRKLF